MKDEGCGSKVSDPDAELVAAAQKELPGAFKQLFDRYWPRVFRLALAALRDEAEAEDCAIETFEDVAHNLAKFRGEARFATWLYRLCFSRIARHKRRIKMEPELVDVDLDRLESGSCPQTEHEERRAFLRVAAEIQRLAPEQARALTLRYLCGLDLDEIALVLGVSVATVKMRLARGAEALAKLRQEQGR